MAQQELSYEQRPVTHEVPAARLDQMARDYWNQFYAGRTATAVPQAPSTFARWALERFRDGSRVVDIGFGNGRDSLWFASQGRSVRGYDFAQSAVRTATNQAEERGLDASFAILDLNDRAQIERVGVEIAEWTPPSTIYGRFLLHALPDQARVNLFVCLAALRRQGCEFMFEFRTGRDAESKHVFGEDHYRNFLDPETVVHELADLGAVITEREAGFGLAPYKEEDPHVCRLMGVFAPESAPQGI